MNSFKEEFDVNMNASDDAWEITRQILEKNRFTVLEEYQQLGGGRCPEDLDECTDALLSHPDYGEMRIGYRHSSDDSHFLMRLLRHSGGKTEIPKLFYFRKARPDLYDQHYTIYTHGYIPAIDKVHMTHSSRIIDWLENDFFEDAEAEMLTKLGKDGSSSSWSKDFIEYFKENYFGYVEELPRNKPKKDALMVAVPFRNTRDKVWYK